MNEKITLKTLCKQTASIFAVDVGVYVNTRIIYVPRPHVETVEFWYNEERDKRTVTYNDYGLPVLSLVVDN